MGAFDLIIFDCDGVLVDSEMLSASVLMGMMREEGLPITRDIFQSDFLGRSFSSAASRTLERFGRAMQESFQEHYRTRLLAKMKNSLKAMGGVESLLDSLATSYCLATSSSPERLAVTLSVTRLERRFAGRSFTASMVAHGKPAPDLFLHAARAMNTPPERCLVVEDSEMGLRAGRAAGMQVCWFAGGAHCKAGYAPPADVTYELKAKSMKHLQRLIRGL